MAHNLNPDASTGTSPHPPIPLEVRNRRRRARSEGNEGTGLGLVEPHEQTNPTAKDQYSQNDGSPASRPEENMTDVESVAFVHQNKARRLRDPKYTEDMSIKKRYLTTVDVAALILNKMVGTGIFTVPGLVLESTEGKGLSILLWVLGGVYCTLCLIIYLDYGTAFPYNGGELIYLNRVWVHPRLLSAVLFAGYFISLGHTAGNAVAFARHVLIAAIPSTDGTQGELHPDKRLVNFIAIAILTVVCLLHFFSARMGMFFNKLLALYKVILLMVVAFRGMDKRKPGDSSHWHWRGSNSNFDSVSAFIYVIYSYTGWENANYVIGEIKAERNTLRNGAFLALGTVTLLYILTVIGYFMACSYGEITGKQNTDLGMAEIFAKNVFGGNTLGLKVCIALSAVGNLVAVVYTSSRVKQAIALHHFIPFSTFFAKDDHFGTPGGALLLHWICSTIVICSIPNSADGYGFLLGLFTYGQLMIGVAIGACFPFLIEAKRNEEKRDGQDGDWRPFISNKWWARFSGLSLVVINLFVLVSAARLQTTYIRRYWWPVTLGSIFIASFFYWFGLRRLQGGLGRLIGWEAKLEKVKDGTDFEIFEGETRRDGAEYKIEYKVTGTVLKCFEKWFAATRRLLDKYIW